MLWGQLSPFCLTPVLGIKLSSVCSQLLLPSEALGWPRVTYVTIILCLYFPLCPLNLSCGCFLYFGNMTVLGVAHSNYSQICKESLPLCYSQQPLPNVGRSPFKSRSRKHAHSRCQECSSLSDLVDCSQTCSGTFLRVGDSEHNPGF